MVFGGDRLRPENIKQRPLSNNPGAWRKEDRDAIDAAITPTVEEKTLHAVEHAIQLLQMVQLGHTLNEDELRLALKQLRGVRMEWLQK